MNRDHFGTSFVEVVGALCALLAVYLTGQANNWNLSPPSVNACFAHSSVNKIELVVENTTSEALTPVGGMLVFGDQNLLYQLDQESGSVVDSGEAGLVSLREIEEPFFDHDVIERNLDDQGEAVMHLYLVSTSGTERELKFPVQVNDVAEFVLASSQRLN